MNAQNRRRAAARLVQSLGRRKGPALDAWLDQTLARDYLSIDEDAVLERYEGLVEKFFVIGREEQSKLLEERLHVLRPLRKREALMQCLHLIAELSNDPSHSPLKLEVETKEQAKPLTWNDIAGDEPFKGDHWEVQDDDDTLSEWSDEEK